MVFQVPSLWSWLQQGVGGRFLDVRSMHETKECVVSVKEAGCVNCRGAYVAGDQKSCCHDTNILLTI